MGNGLSTEPGCVINYEHTWVHSTAGSGIPPNGVVGGHDSDGSTIYVGRAYHEGDHLPAKIVPSKGHGYVAWGGEEIEIHHYEILCGHNFNWIPCAMGRVPFNAVRSGTTSTGEVLYIGRGHWQGSLTVGKIHPTHHCLYIPYAGKEHRLDTYEVLIHERGEIWSPNSGSKIPAGAVPAGHDSDGSQIYVGRAYHNGALLPAKVIPRKGCAYVCNSGREIKTNAYEILTGHGFTWSPSAGGHVPPNAVAGGYTDSKEPLFIGRGHHCGSLTVGKIHPSHRCLYIPYGDAEVKLDHYEVLIKN